MQNTIFLDNHYYHLTDDPHKIRDLADYETVREQLNRGYNPLAGGPNWEEVHTCCMRLAKGPGLDFLMTAYFTLASLKVQGLSGYANGLELLTAHVSQRGEPSSKQASAHKDIIDWVNTRVAKELKELKPDYAALRDLYRAERYCERLHQLLEQQQPSQIVDFESVGFALFEHIDRIEARYHTLMKRQDKEVQAQQATISRQRYYWSLIVACIVGGLLVIGAWYGYQNLAWFHKNDYATSQSVPILQSSAQAKRYQKQVSKTQLERWKHDVVPLYSTSIKQHMSASMLSHPWRAQQEMAVLNTLYPGSSQVAELNNELHKTQQDALAQTERFIERFKQIRTTMANVSLMAKKGHLHALQQHTQDLENFAVSLSPIYGRVDYVQTLIKRGEMDKANKEFLVLKQRLTSLSWQMLQLRQRLRPEAQTKALIGQ